MSGSLKGRKVINPNNNYTNSGRTRNELYNIKAQLFELKSFLKQSYLITSKRLFQTIAGMLYENSINF